MITLIRLKPDVTDFLDITGHIQIELGVKSYIVNNQVYSETDEPEVYMVTTLETPTEVGEA